MSEALFDLQDRVVVITGAAGLIGRCYTAGLLEAGARVVIADIDGTAANELGRSFDPQRVLAVQADVSQPSSVKHLFEHSLDHFGRIDGLVNNAAIDPKADPAHAAKHKIDFENFPFELWQMSMDVNITGMFLCAQAAARVMVKQGKGVIVNISSTYGLVGPDQRLYEKDEPHGEPVFYKPVTYSVSKSAVFGLTRYLATYYGRQGIRANTLTLGGVYNHHDADFVKRYSWRTPLGRMAQPEEYNGALIFLLSDASSYMTGANLVIDGGWTAW